MRTALGVALIYCGVMALCSTVMIADKPNRTGLDVAAALLATGSVGLPLIALGVHFLRGSRKAKAARGADPHPEDGSRDGTRRRSWKRSVVAGLLRIYGAIFLLVAIGAVADPGVRADGWSAVGAVVVLVAGLAAFGLAHRVARGGPASPKAWAGTLGGPAS